MIPVAQPSIKIEMKVDNQSQAPQFNLDMAASTLSDKMLQSVIDMQQDPDFKLATGTKSQVIVQNGSQEGQVLNAALIKDQIDYDYL